MASKRIEVSGADNKEYSDEKIELFRRLSSGETASSAAHRADAPPPPPPELQSSAVVGGARRKSGGHRRTSSEHRDPEEVFQIQAEAGRRLSEMDTESHKAYRDEKTEVMNRERAKRETVSYLLAQQQNVRSGYTHRK